MPPLACEVGQDPLVYSYQNPSFPFLPDEGRKSWVIGNSSSLYRIDRWGAPYFFINERGNMAVRPHGNATSPREEIDIMVALRKIAEPKSMGGLGIPLPLIIRFPDVLKNRLETLQSSFDHAISVHGYKRQFQGVFPVKCNQDRFVVENIVSFGKPHVFGLEAGSKPELLLAMTCLCKGCSEALLICNGYKDLEYVGLALTARQLGLNCVIVLEQEEELEIVIRMSQHLCIQPVIGLRAKLNTKHEGHFGETSGEKGKFGLSSSEIVRVIQKLSRAGMLECLELLHFHIGSQIPSLAVIHDGVTEAAHIYCELALMGASMQYIDVGGGLGIDYDGSGSANSDSSVGYTIVEYAKGVVKAVKEACSMKNVRQPILCSESGRALVSNHSVLVFDVFSAKLRGCQARTDLGGHLEVEGLPEDLGCLCSKVAGHARAGEFEIALDCAKQLKRDCTDLFKHGDLSLMQIGTITGVYEVLSKLVDERQQTRATMAPSLESMDSNCDGVLGKAGANEHDAVYHVNLSIFKSMPDTWAIGQLFPIVPLHRLEEQPSVRAILSDLTCDSDGKISKFIGTDAWGKRLRYLPVHSLESDKPYIMGMFLGGAYQEALGSMHNLFGRPSIVHVVQEAGGNGFNIASVITGETSADVLRCMQHDPGAMFEDLKRRVQECVHLGRFGEDEGPAMAIAESLACTFGSSTYLSNPLRACYSSLDHLNKPAVDSVTVEQVYCCI